MEKFFVESKRGVVTVPFECSLSYRPTWHSDPPSLAALTLSAVHFLFLNYTINLVILSDSRK